MVHDRVGDLGRVEGLAQLGHGPLRVADEVGELLQEVRGLVDEILEHVGGEAADALDQGVQVLQAAPLRQDAGLVAAFDERLEVAEADCCRHAVSRTLST